MIAIMPRNIQMSLADYIGKYWAGAQAIYSVIIAMTFTSVLRNYLAIPEEANFNVVSSALFCCIAWGIADGSFYAWERRYNLRLENEIIDISKSDQRKDSAIPLIMEQLDDTILRNINDETRIELYRNLVRHLATNGVKTRIAPRDALYIMAGTLFVSTVSGLIVVIPFFLVDNLRFALDISNCSGVFLLFIIGYYGTHERNLSDKVISGLGTAIIGIIITVITILLGG